MELKICHLYPDLLNTYGDFGNLLLFKQRAMARGIDVTISNVSIGDEFGDYDFVFIGGGQDFEQSIVAADLLLKKPALAQYIETGGVCLAICGGYQLMGEYYSLPNGDKMEATSILPIYTKAGQNRLIGNVVVDADGDTLVGFENHSGRTYIGDLKPLGMVTYGNGNNGEDKTEGCIYKNTYCTYLHGPLFSKNPSLSDKLLLKALINRYGSAELEPIDYSLEINAKKELLQKLKLI